MNTSPKRVLIGVCGGIAAYKVCEVISTIFQAGVQVKVILTASAVEFITPLTVSTLSRHSAYTDTDFWQPVRTRPLHIELGEWADLILIAPLTANTLAKLTWGLADNLLTNTVLASKCPILLAPAMNTDMWEQMAVQRNWQQLVTDTRYHAVGMGTGLLACDRVGTGRMAEPQQIVRTVQSLLHTGGKRDLIGRKVLISAGGTREHIDPVRFIGNPSTGKMGIALAEAALSRGAEVTLVCGVLSSEILVSGHPLLKIISVVSAADLERALLAEFTVADVTIMCAAVADVKPSTYSSEKLPKKSLPQSLALTPVTDIVAKLGEIKQPHQKLVGFAAQTGDIVAPALEKLLRKRLDAIVANPVDEVGSGFGSDRNRAVIIAATGEQKEIAHCSKLEMAHYIFDFLPQL